VARTLISSFKHYWCQSATLIGYLAMSYLLGLAAIVGLPLGLTVLLVIVGHIAGKAVGNEGFPFVVIVLGFVFSSDFFSRSLCF
jgi:hypothetical protein